MIIITNLDPEGKYTDNNSLKVGYREQAKPYSGEKTNDPNQRMNPKYIGDWLDKIEAAHRGFEHNNNTYYGYEYNNLKPESIPYSGKIIYGSRNKKGVYPLSSVKYNTTEPWYDDSIEYAIDGNQLIEGIESLEKIHKNYIKHNNE
jgi:hypothetical protein